MVFYFIMAFLMLILSGFVNAGLYSEIDEYSENKGWNPFLFYGYAMGEITFPEDMRTWVKFVLSSIIFIFAYLFSLSVWIISLRWSKWIFIKG